MKNVLSIIKKIIIVFVALFAIIIGAALIDGSNDDEMSSNKETNVESEEPVLLGYYTMIGFEQTESEGYWEFYSDYTTVEVNTPVEIEKWNNGGVILFSETIDFDSSDDDIDRVYGAMISEDTGWEWKTMPDLEQAPIEFQTFLKLHCEDMNEELANK